MSVEKNNLVTVDSKVEEVGSYIREEEEVGSYIPEADSRLADWDRSKTVCIGSSTRWKLWIFKKECCVVADVGCSFSRLYMKGL